MSKATRTFIAVAGVVGVCAALGAFCVLRLKHSKPIERPGTVVEPEPPDPRPADELGARLAKLLDARNTLGEQPAEGVRKLREIIASHPNSGEAFEARILLAQALTKQGDTEAALRELDAVIQSPEQGRRVPRALMLRADLIRTTDEAAARQVLEAVRNNKGYPDFQMTASLALGLIELEHGQFEKALTYLEKVAAVAVAEQAEAVKAVRRAVLGRLKTLADAGNWQGVIGWADEKAKEFASLTTLRHVLAYHRAIAYRNLGQFAEARVLLDRLTRDVPSVLLGSDVDIDAERAAIAKAEEAVGIRRSPEAFLRAKKAGKDARPHVEGAIAADTTWGADKGPLVLTGVVTVKQGATLTLEAGLTVQFLTGTRIVVEGALAARGTADQPIRFTSAATKAPTFFDGDGIEFADSSDDAKCVLDHCVIEYQRIGVACRSAKPSLRHCTFRNTGEKALHVEDTDLTVEGCTFEANDGTAIYAQRANMVIRQCRIVRNGQDGISLNGRSASQIEANRITGNGGIGISCDNDVAATVKDNEIAENKGDGIYANRFSVLKIVNNVIHKNGGAGVNCERDSAPEITGNAITESGGNAIRLNRSDGIIRANNLLRSRASAVYCAENASPKVEGNWVERTHGAGVACGETCSPVITGNAFIGYDPCPLSTLGKQNINAQGNYYASGRDPKPVPDDKLDKQIMDKADMHTLGEIVWRPRLDAPPPRPPMPKLPALP